MQRAAEQNGLSPQEQADRTSKRFKEAWDLLDIAYDDFIRTTEPRHHTAVQTLLKRCYENGYVYKDTYQGAYCVACEAYYAEADLVDGNCPIHGVPVEQMTEDNYFFRLSAFRDRLLEWFEDVPDNITPERYRNEARALVRGGLEDLSITRTSLQWGIPVPWDRKHVFYVWYDALTNYATAAGYGTGRRAFRHVVAGVPPPARQGHHPLPLRVLAGDAHGGGRGTTAAVPRARVAAGERCQDGQVQRDADRSGRPRGQHRRGRSALLGAARQPVRPRQRLQLRGAGAALQQRPGQRLGNLLQRVTTIVSRSSDSVGSAPAPDSPLGVVTEQAYEAAAVAWDRVQPSVALEATWGIVRETNEYLQARQPWKLDPGPELDVVLGDALEALRIAAVLAHPAMPRSCAEVWRRIGLDGDPSESRLPGAVRWGQYPAGLTVTVADPLFPRLSVD